ncbi:MAG: ferritin family protein [Nitrospirae bacterium]|nr:ferritin family protein [Nitrospirota bacterium]
MVTGKEDLMQSLIEAYLMEKGTMEFYSRAADKVIDPEVKKTFRSLSSWEERHMDFIRFLYQSVMDDRDIIGFEQFKDKTDTLFTEAGIPVKELEGRIEQKDFSNDMEAITLALDIEGGAYRLYRGLSQSAGDSNARVVFQEMMEYEAKHIDYLQKISVNYLKNVSVEYLKKMRERLTDNS